MMKEAIRKVLRTFGYSIVPQIPSDFEKRRIEISSSR